MNETCDPATDPGCEVTDSGGDTADTGGDTTQFQTYHYVLIEDLDDEASGDRPGADIDGVELRAGGGQGVYLAQIHDEGFGGEQPPSGAANRNFNNALGTPEANCIGESPANWDPTEFVSLGGTGGFFIGSFQGTAEIETGDIITVHACSGDLSNEWQITVGVADSLSDPTWQQLNPIGTGVGVANFTVPNLPNIPRN